MSYTINTLPTRPIEELRGKSLNDLTSVEIAKLEKDDPESYKLAADALNPPPPDPANPVPEPVKRFVSRNGQLIEDDVPVHFVNGVRQ